MNTTNGRQSRRVARRRSAERYEDVPPATTEVRGTGSAEQRRQALLAMIALGVTFVGACVAYVVLAAGSLLG
jgi:hypothetical protein